MALDGRSIIAESLAEERGVLFAYLFGSQANGTAAARSDWDVAIYIPERLLEANPVWQKFGFEDALAQALGTDAVEVVILNRLDDAVLAFEIINNGILVVEKDRQERTAFEGKVLGRYQDWQYFANRSSRKIVGA
jgi:predicted nucleotidyltransferase